MDHYPATQVFQTAANPPPMDDTKFAVTNVSTNKKKLCGRGHWRPHEDATLKNLVAQFGPQNWNLIAEKLQGRSGKSCRLRWFNQLDPRITKRAFSEEEEERLLAAHATYGNKWAAIARLFPGRTDNAVKNHWHVITARMNRQLYYSTVRRRRRGINYPNSSCGESFVHNNNYNNNNFSNGSDESCTSTDLSLVSPSSIRTPGFVMPPRLRQGTMINSDKKGEDDGHGKEGGFGAAGGAEEDECSGVVGGWKKRITCGGSGNNGHKGNTTIDDVGFIDFLGVGST